MEGHPLVRIRWESNEYITMMYYNIVTTIVNRDFINDGIEKDRDNKPCPYYAMRPMGG
jgi:hypothetical protein